MTSLHDALASCARRSALQQRAHLLQAVWNDGCDQSRSVLRTLFPSDLLPLLTWRPDRLGHYAVDGAYEPDGVWRVSRDHVGRHCGALLEAPHCGALLEAPHCGALLEAPHCGAALLQSPLLAVFLPTLCRVLLGQSLLLPSSPVWWLGDAATRPMLAAHPDRFTLRDAIDPDCDPVPLAGLASADRCRLQRAVDAAPRRFVATLNPRLLQSGGATGPLSSAFPHAPATLQYEFNGLFRHEAA